MSGEARLDIRIPVGGLFSILGLIIAVYGLVSDKSIYDKSQGLNVNLWWGLAMLAFGVIMLLMARRGAAPAKTQPKATHPVRT
jgi:hypothetical protein